MPNRQTNKQEVSIPSTLLKHRNGWIYWLVVTGRHASLSLDHDVVIHYHSPGDSKINQTWTLASSSLFPLFLYSSKDSSFCCADICLSDNKSRLMVNRCRLRNRKFTFLFKFELEIRRNSVFHLSTCQLASIKWQWERASEEKELIRFTKHWLGANTRAREASAAWPWPNHNDMCSAQSWSTRRHRTNHVTIPYWMQPSSKRPLRMWTKAMQSTWWNSATSIHFWCTTNQSTQSTSKLCAQSSAQQFKELNFQFCVYTF